MKASDSSYITVTIGSTGGAAFYWTKVESVIPSRRPGMNSRSELAKYVKTYWERLESFQPVSTGFDSSALKFISGPTFIHYPPELSIKIPVFKLDHIANIL